MPVFLRCRRLLRCLPCSHGPLVVRYSETSALLAFLLFWTSACAVGNKGSKFHRHVRQGRYWVDAQHHLHCSNCISSKLKTPHKTEILRQNMKSLPALLVLMLVVGATAGRMMADLPTNVATLSWNEMHLGDDDICTVYGCDPGRCCRLQFEEEYYIRCIKSDEECPPLS